MFDGYKVSFNFSGACAIEFDDKVVLTGGKHYVREYEGNKVLKVIRRDIRRRWPS